MRSAEALEGMALRSVEALDGMSPLMFSLQALLMRHESYVADSERERKAMTSQIDTLVAEKATLEQENATVIAENRGLLDQLEALNTAYSKSDEHVTSLQATLASTNQEIQKLAQLGTRAEKLEHQLLDFEKDQAEWQSSLDAKEQSERAAVRRWQHAERTLSKLQESIERIEQESKVEKERHAEIVGRMERRHAVEKELVSAAGRLKDAAAAKADGFDGCRTNVVSHFVKDILQDNANLQLGIIELREMLNGSNDEVERLRGQLLIHQPADDDEASTTPGNHRNDLGMEMNRASSQELHVHHHYHAPSSASKTQSLRRPRKKRYSAFGSGQMNPISGTSTPRTSFSYGTPSPLAAILQQTSASLPQPVSDDSARTTQAEHHDRALAALSGPSSPLSTTNRTSSFYDRVFSDAGHESSRPTTPDTDDPGSPDFVPAYSKRGFQPWLRTVSAPAVQRRSVSSKSRQRLDTVESMEELPTLEPEVSMLDEITDEVVPEDNQISSNDAMRLASPIPDKRLDIQMNDSIYQPALRRAASHESLFSVSGMDVHVHALRSRPSQLLAPSAVRSQAVISGTTAHATRPADLSRTAANSRSLLSGVAAEQRPPSKPTLGKKVGGWVFGRWGATPASTTADVVGASNKAPTKASTEFGAKADAVVSPDLQAASKKPKLRPPGINQSGPLLGYFPEVTAPRPCAPVLQSLDADALRAVLDGA